MEIDTNIAAKLEEDLWRKVGEPDIFVCKSWLVQQFSKENDAAGIVFFPTSELLGF